MKLIAIIGAMLGKGFEVFGNKRTINVRPTKKKAVPIEVDSKRLQAAREKREKRIARNLRNQEAKDAK